MIRYLSYILLSSLLFTALSCSKPDPAASLPLQQYFEANILNQDFVVSFAKDSTGEITPEYGGYVFVLLKTDFYHGPLKVTRGDETYEGTWSSNEDYGKLTITLPGSPSVFIFLSRDWRFTKKDIPTLELAPWGTTQPFELHMTRQ